MNVETKYDLRDMIKIKDLNAYPGRIEEIHIKENIVYYLISYWWEGEVKFINLREEELEKMNAVKK